MDSSDDEMDYDYVEERARQVRKFGYLLDDDHLEGDDLYKITDFIYECLVRCNSHKPYNTHNLEVLLHTFPDERHFTMFFKWVFYVEVPIVKVLLELCDLSFYKKPFRKIMMSAIDYRKSDVFETLLPVLYPYLEKKNVKSMLSKTIFSEDIVMFRFALQYVEKYCAKKNEDPLIYINNSRVSWSLARAPVIFFHEMYLLGFNVFISYEGKNFVQVVVSVRNYELLAHLFDLNVMQDGDLFDIPGTDRRNYYHFLLRVNDEVNKTREKEETKDIFLRRFVPLQQVPLTAARALYRELCMNNRYIGNERFAMHTEVYLNSLRPETNGDLATSLRLKREEKKRARPFLM